MPQTLAVQPSTRVPHRGLSRPVLINLLAIVTAEIVAFALLEKSLSSKKNEAGLTAAAVLIMLIVPFSFKAMLSGGETIAMANLYWIVLSMILGAALSGLVFKQRVSALQIAGMAIAVTGAGVAYAGSS